VQNTCVPVHERRICGNTDTGLLKLLALIFMITDHIGSALLPGIFELRMIGRLAFPLYLWCCVVGVEYTRNPWKYALRVLICGFISQPFYMWGLNHKLTELNVMFTLFFGIVALACIREKKYYSHIWGPILCILCGCVLKMDYGWRGILLMITLYCTRKNKGALTLAFFAFCLYWGTESASVYDVFGIRLPDTPGFMTYGGSLVRAIKKLQFMAFYSLPFMLIENKKGRLTRLPRWLGYSAYPGHLAIIALIRHVLLP